MVIDGCVDVKQQLFTVQKRKKKASGTQAAAVYIHDKKQNRQVGIKPQLLPSGVQQQEGGSCRRSR